MSLVARLRKPFLCLFGFLLGFWALLRAVPLPVEKLKGDYSTAYLASDGSLLRLTVSKSGKYRLPLKLDEISPQVVQGFTAYEDRWFYWHYGVNPVALVRAAYLDITHHKIVSGASTITMQVAKLLDKRPRTFWSKAIETFRAMQLEARYSKKQILEFYLNSVPMGGNIEGVGAASLLYFGKPAKELSWGETALLISLPRSPAARRPDRFPEKAREGRDKVLAQILPIVKPPKDQADEAYHSILPKGRFTNPNPAPHLVVRATQMKGRATGVITLTLKPNLQGLAQRLLSEAVGDLRNQGVHNGAVMIVDNHTMKVLAYVGTADFQDPLGGQVNGADIPRSPGSSLKPFLYGLAIDHGMITPKTMLYDIPRDYGGYTPANYEGKFSGLMTAEDALARSLNIPAVGLESSLEAMGNDGLEFWVKAAGCVGRGRGQLEPGLSVVLGAYPMTLEEMVRLYAALANGGRMRNLQFFEGSPLNLEELKGKALLSPEASYLVSEMLSKVERTDIPASWEFSPTRGRVAFKTGTSFGHRDAWCIGYNPDYTIGVWLGNANNDGAVALVGHDAAAPIVINLFNELTRTTDSWFKRPPGVQVRKVCALSGQPAGDDCKDVIEDEFIPGVSDNRVCQVHRRVWIRKKDGKEVCRYCMTGKPEEYYSKVFEVWPPDVTRFLRSHGAKFQAIPPHNPDCTYFASRFTPRINSPKPGKYEIQPGIPLESQRISLSVQAGPDVEEVYWFLNGRLVDQGKPDETFFLNPQQGKWEVSVVDSRGRADKVNILVFDKKQ